MTMVFLVLLQGPRGKPGLPGMPGSDGLPVSAPPLSSTQYATGNSLSDCLPFSVRPLTVAADGFGFVSAQGNLVVCGQCQGSTVTVSVTLSCRVTQGRKVPQEPKGTR